MKSPVSTSRPVSVSSPVVARNALVLIAVVTTAAALVWLADILTPLAMAIFLMIVIDGVKRTIEERTPLPRRDTTSTPEVSRASRR